MSTSRTIRVYLASSFRDMKAERELLYATVFPQLQARCKERGLAFEVIDLRASASSEVEALTSVAARFADEIDLCSPYFIGLLGDRCSGAADIPEEAYTRLPWLKDEVAAGKPLLELEFLHGALRNPSGSKAMFYLRDTEFTTMSADTGGVALLPVDPREMQSTVRIKDAIRNSGLQVCENYANPGALGARIAADLTIEVDRLISNAPATTQLSPMQLQQLLTASMSNSSPTNATGADPGDAMPTSSPAPPHVSDHAPSSGRRVRIVHMSGSHARTTQDFNMDTQDEVWIGRDPVSHVRFSEGDQSVSRAHMKIVPGYGDPNSYILISRGRNGTFINNTEIAGSAALREGDFVQVGRGGPLFKFEQFPKMAAQQGWQEPDLPPIAAPAPIHEPGRVSSATTVLNFDPAIAKAMMEALQKPGVTSSPVQEQAAGSATSQSSETPVSSLNGPLFQKILLVSAAVVFIVFVIYRFLLKR